MSRSSSTFSPDMRCPSVGSGTSSSMLSRDEAKQLFERTQQRWSQTHDQLNSAIRDRATSPWNSRDLRQKDAVISTLQRQLQDIQMEMNRYKQELQIAEATIVQQQVTIRNQSKAIENPRPFRDPSTTPRRQDNYRAPGAPSGNAGYPPSFGMQQPYFNQIQQPEPHWGAGPALSTQSSFTSFGSNEGSHVDSNSTGHTPQVTTRAGILRANEYGSPAKYKAEPPITLSATLATMSTNSASTNKWSNNHDPFSSASMPMAPAHSAYHTQRFHNSQTFTSPESVVSNPYPETSLVLSSVARNEVMVREGLQRVFNLAQGYAFKHANYPSTAGDYAMPQATKDRILAGATTTTAFKLMSDCDTRYLLVSKVMLQWIIKHILKYSTFSGLDTKADQVMNGAKATIYQSTPPALRFLILTNVANELRKIRERSDFAAYVNHLCQQRAEQLLQLFRPTMHQLPQGEIQDLEEILHEAYKVAELMFSGTDEFSFEFPSYSKRYDEREMINVDPTMIGYNASVLGQMEAYVRLGTTPLVRTRRNMENGECPAQILLKAKVLLKK